MPTYTTVAMKQIQTHLMRSRHLWGRRGASEELEQLTTLPQRDPQGAVATVLQQHPDVQVCPEALDIDGVVVFESNDEASVAAGHDYAMAIRRRLPEIALDVAWSQAERFVDILAVAPDHSKTYRQSVYDFPLVRRCAECNSAAAVMLGKVFEHMEKDPVVPLCRDCWVRRPDPGRQRQLNSRLRDQGVPARFVAELELLHATTPPAAESGGSHDSPRAWNAVRDFNDLARMVSRDETSAVLRKRFHLGNHTMLVFADANGLGALFAAAQERALKSGSTTEMRELSATIKNSTKAALKQATHHIVEEHDTAMPVVPHIVGGDDVLLSLPADRGWRFLIRFLHLLRDKLGGSGAAAVSFSAGVVICKAAFPIGDQVELAERLMRRAKADVAGNGWNFLWQDVTYDGVDDLPRAAWTLEELEERRRALSVLSMQITGAGQSRLLESVMEPHIRDAALRVADACRKVPAARELLRLLDVRNPLSDFNEPVRTLLLDLLSMRRWWR